MSRLRQLDDSSMTGAWGAFCAASRGARRRLRQRDRKPGPLPRLAFDVEVPAVAVDDVFDDGEPQPRSALLATLHDVDAIEALGQARQVLRRDARAVILHVDGHMRRLPPMV